jgi:putative endonuclease
LAGRSSDDRRAALQWGHDAETAVCEHLIELGWRVLARNWRGAGGELDIVVRRRDAVRFVEVKARPTSSQALEAITSSKRTKLMRAAEAWLATCDEDFEEVAFLVALVVRSEGRCTITLIDDAFDGV